MQRSVLAEPDDEVEFGFRGNGLRTFEPGVGVERFLRPGLGARHGGVAIALCRRLRSQSVATGRLAWAAQGHPENGVSFDDDPALAAAGAGGTDHRSGTRLVELKGVAKWLGGQLVAPRPV